MLYNKELTHNAIKYSYSKVFSTKNIKTFDGFLKNLQKFVRYNESDLTEKNIDSEDFMLIIETFHIPISTPENFYSDFKKLLELRKSVVIDYVYRYIDSMIHNRIKILQFGDIYDSRVNELLYIGRRGTMFDHTPIDAEHDPWHIPLRGGMFDHRPVRYDD